MKYLLSYDLIGAESLDYQKIRAALKAEGGEQELRTEWILERTETSAEEVFNAIRHLFDRFRPYKIIICEFGPNEFTTVQELFSKS